MPHKNFRVLRDQILADPARAALYEQARQRAEAELVAYEQTLTELRRARAFTQAQLAKSLGVSQAQVSRIEHQSDLYLSTLESYIEAMGGRLELVATFADIRVTLALADLTEREEAVAESDEAPAAVS
jgi:transcriptional regulator with XRE-family HTH domain